LNQGRLDLDIKDAEYDPDSGKLIALLSDSSPNFGNTVVSIDPLTFHVSALFSTTSDHNFLRLNSDHSRLYIATDSTVSIYDTTSFNLIGSIQPPAPRPELAGDHLLVDLKASPSAPETIAIVLRHIAFQVADVFIYEDTKLLTRKLSDLVSLIEPPDIAFSTAGDGLFVKTNRIQINLNKYLIDGSGFQSAEPGISAGTFNLSLRVKVGKIYVDEIAFDEQSLVITEAFDSINSEKTLIDIDANRFYAMDGVRLAIYQLNNAGNAEIFTLSGPLGSHQPFSEIYSTPHSIFLPGNGETSVIDKSELSFEDVPTDVLSQAQILMDTGQCPIELHDPSTSSLIFNCEVTEAAYDPIADKYYVGVSKIQENVGPAIAVIDAASMTADHYIQLSATPYKLDLSANSLYLYISYDGLQRVTRIALSDYDLVEILLLPRATENGLESRSVRDIHASTIQDELLVVSVVTPSVASEIVLFGNITEIDNIVFSNFGLGGDHQFSMASSGDFYFTSSGSVNRIERFSLDSDGLQSHGFFTLSDVDTRSMSQHITTSEQLFFFRGSIVNLNDQSVDRIDTDADGFFHVSHSPDLRTVYFLSGTRDSVPIFSVTAFDATTLERLGSVDANTRRPQRRVRLERLVVGDRHLLLITNNPLSGSIDDRSKPLVFIDKSAIR
jgi:hypothetical protein